MKAAAQPVEVRYVSARHRNDIGYSMVANDTLRRAQRDESRDGCDIWHEGKAVKKAMGGGISAGQYKIFIMRAAQLVRFRQRDGAITELTVCDLAGCLSQSEQCRTRVLAHKRRRLSRYIAAAKEGGRLVKVGPKRYEFQWHGSAPKKATKPLEKQDVQFRQVCRKDCSFCGPMHRKAPSAPARSIRVSRKKDGRGGHAAWQNQPRGGSGRFGSAKQTQVCHATAQPVRIPSPEPAQRADGPQAACSAHAPPRLAIIPCHDAAAARAELARLHQAEPAPEPRAKPRAAAPPAQQSAPRGRLAVVPPLWRDCRLSDDHVTATREWVVSMVTQSKHLAQIALLPLYGLNYTRGAWRAAFGGVVGMAPGAVREPHKVAFHLAGRVHDRRAPDPRRQPGYRPMPGWGEKTLALANVSLVEPPSGC